MSGQTLTDRIAAAQYQLTGSDMARAVCKATTHEVMAPKKKHLECKCGPHPHCTDCSFIGPRPYRYTATHADHASIMGLFIPFT